MSTNKVYVIGVGLTQFLKPRGKVSYTELGLQAAVKALVDCNLTYDAIEQAYCGYIYGDSTCGQRVLYQLGMTQIPIVNVNNNCSTGSTALWMGRNAIRGGSADCVLCVGWEEMEAGRAPNYGRGILIVGPLKNKFPKHTSPLGKSYEVMSETRGFDTGPLTAQIFGNAGIEYMEKYGAKPEHFAEIARINHAHRFPSPPPT
jgi:sterol carrier protein 2